MILIFDHFFVDLAFQSSIERKDMIKQVLLVGAGGAVGSIFRFLISEITGRYYVQSFPLATFVINVLGCFIIGLLVNMLPANANLKLILIVGFCGGFTTFSTFARESMDLINQQQSFLALLYVVASSVVGITAVWVGMQISK